MRRRDILQAVVAGTATVVTRRARAQQKLSQHDAQYQDTPKDNHACGECTLFQPPKSCKVVAGDVSPHGWCQLFEESPE